MLVFLQTCTQTNPASIAWKHRYSPEPAIQTFLSCLWLCLTVFAHLSVLLCTLFPLNRVHVFCIGGAWCGTCRAGLVLLCLLLNCIATKSGQSCSSWQSCIYQEYWKMAWKGCSMDLWCPCSDCLPDFSLKFSEGMKVRSQTCCFVICFQQGEMGPESYFFWEHIQKVTLFILLMRHSPRICVIPACLAFYTYTTASFGFCTLQKANKTYQLYILFLFYFS